MVQELTRSLMKNFRVLPAEWARYELLLHPIMNVHDFGAIVRGALELLYAEQHELRMLRGQMLGQDVPPPMTQYGQKVKARNERLREALEELRKAKEELVKPVIVAPTVRRPISRKTKPAKKAKVKA